MLAELSVLMGAPLALCLSMITLHAVLFPGGHPQSTIRNPQLHKIVVMCLLYTP